MKNIVLIAAAVVVIIVVRFLVSNADGLLELWREGSRFVIMCLKARRVVHADEFYSKKQ